MSDGQIRRTVLAPPPIINGTQPPTSLISVDLAEGEDVEWTWTFLPDGGRYVSGYTLLKTAV